MTTPPDPLYKENREKTTDDRGASLSFSASLPTPEPAGPPPAPKAPESPTTNPWRRNLEPIRRPPADRVTLPLLTAKARAAFPADDTPALGKTLAGYVDYWREKTGAAEDAALDMLDATLDYAIAWGEARTVGLLFTLLKAWIKNRYNLVDVRGMADAARSRRRTVKTDADFHRAKAEPETDSETERLNAEALAALKRLTRPSRAGERLEALADLDRIGAAGAQKEPAASPPCKSDSRPAGNQSACELPPSNPTVNGYSRQGFSGGNPQRAWKDSNLQPSDSKSATLSVELQARVTSRYCIKRDPPGKVRPAKNESRRRAFKKNWPKWRGGKRPRLDIMISPSTGRGGQDRPQRFAPAAPRADRSK